MVTLLHPDDERCDCCCMQRVVPVLSRSSCAGGILKLPVISGLLTLNIFVFICVFCSASGIRVADLNLFSSSHLCVFALPVISCVAVLKWSVVFGVCAVYD